ncbi:MAG: ribosome rescue protein RqcH [Thermoplasmata archaeon]
MKEALTSFDIRLLVEELQGLRGAYLDKVYQDDASFIFRFNVPRRGKKELFVQPGRWLFLGQGFKKPAQPPPFAQALRKALSNAVIREVSQRGFDRILLLEWERRTPGTLVFEMFGRGNLLLLKDGEIEVTLGGGKWKAREVRRGIPYAFPPEGVNLLEIERPDLSASLAGQSGPLVKTLATTLGLGKLYAEELCIRAELKGQQPVGDLTETEIDTLYEKLQTLLSQIDSPSPAVVMRDGPIDVIPFPLQVYEGDELRPFAAMSEALQFYVTSLAPSEKEKPDPAVAKMERRIRRQEQTLTEALEGAEVASQGAAYLYAHYQDVDRQLGLAREGRLREGVDPERKTLVIPAGQTSLELRYDESVDENAQRFYEQKRALTEKGVRIERALAASQGELRRVRKSARRRERRRPLYSASKRFWFDAYRWTLSSEKILILGGRDARSNEKLVRKHLSPGDRYLHADLTGAPSVVVKGGAEADDQTLREASRFALIYSKAWKHGLGSGSAFWVTPDQVSKTAESGEFVKQGSFVIRGKRNYVHKLALVLGVGEVEVEGSRRIMGGDPDALRTLSRRYLLVKPAGPVRRQDLARSLSHAFEVPAVEAERILPTGAFEVTEVHGLREDLFAAG